MFEYPINVTLDTNIFDAAKYDFEENSTLQLLAKYVRSGKVKVVLSNIVVKEAEKHIAEQGMKICSIVQKAKSDMRKIATKQMMEHIGLSDLLEISVDKDLVRTKSIDLLNKYIEDIDAEIMDTKQIDWEAIIEDYFEIRPPFQQGEKKRKEFPDAFIAEQIRKRFGTDETVVIISNDKGFKTACQNTSNHIFFSSLGEFYNELNKQEQEAYEETIRVVENIRNRISSEISEYVFYNENIEVIGLSQDKDGIIEGYDYSETYLDTIENLSFAVYSVDDMNSRSFIVTIKCKADITANCYYDDYENGIWDSEDKRYLFIETIGVREEHQARFGCRIKIDRETEDIEIIPFKIILGGDTRKQRYRIADEMRYDYE